MAAQPQHFDSLFAAIVGAAERTSQLPESLAGHARYRARVDTLRPRRIGAALFPLLLVLASPAVVALIDEARDEACITWRDTATAEALELLLSG